MSETTELLDSPRGESPAQAKGLSTMVLPDLKAIASRLGIKGTSAMRKGDLVAAISARQSSEGGGGADAGSQPPRARRAASRPAGGPASPSGDGAPGVETRDDSATRPDVDHSSNGASGHAEPAAVTAPAEQRTDNAPAAVDAQQPHQGGESRPESSTGEGAERPPRQAGDTGQNGSDEYPSRDRSRRNRRNRRDRPADGAADTNDAGDRQTPPRNQGNQGSQGNQGNQGNQGAPNRDNQGSQGNQGRVQNRDQNREQNRDADDDLDGDGNRRGRRYRDRNRRGRERFTETPGDTEVRDDDVLLPVAGILDVLDSYAFVRTSGYLTGSNDVYVSLSQVRKYHLRRGDAVTGAVRAPRENEAARQKFNALVRLDTINGLDPEQAKNRPEFTKLTPLYPNERLRLETEAHILTTRVIDLVMPVGKGQRALIVSPPKAGKTSVLQAIANAISTNNPECHLMVVLVDERPEEVTDMQRSVKGEVIASTFDRPPADHTQVAELAIERAKRLVEMGRDVVVLLDSITRLGRAYNLAAPASGRILSGGVDSTALFPPKRFLGAARNIENGGSLTIFASALVETGSAGDTVIFEEFKGTGNAELKLDRRIADKRVFPAIDIDQSSTRKEDLLMSPDEHAVVIKLRRVLGALESQAALDLVLGRLRKTRSNVEFLMQVAATTPNADRDRD